MKELEDKYPVTMDEGDFADCTPSQPKNQKLITVGPNPEYDKALKAFLKKGFVIKAISACASGSNTCCYILLEKY